MSTAGYLAPLQGSNRQILPGVLKRKFRNLVFEGSSPNTILPTDLDLAYVSAITPVTFDDPVFVIVTGADAGKFSAKSSAHTVELPSACWLQTTKEPGEALLAANFH